MNASTRRPYVALGVVLAIFATVAYAATFPYFSPATGILKGNAASYVTTAAASSDVIGLWTGTCNGSSALKGDGTCGTLAAGTVSSVGLTMPSGFSVSGSPVTTTGTLGVTTTLNGPLKGNGSGFTTAASADIVGLWTGTCTGVNYLAANGTCQAISAGGVTSVAAGTGISASPSPIVSTGTISTDPNYLTSVTTTAQVAKGTSFTALQYGNATSNPTHTFLGTGHMIVNSNLVDVNALQALSVSAGSVDAPAVTVSGVNVCQNNGTNCSTLNASNLTSGTVGTARLGSGTANSGTFLRGDQTWAAPTVSGLKIVWGRIQSTGTITESGTFGGASFSSVTKGTTGKYQLNYSGFTTGPACTCTIKQSGSIYTCMNDAGAGQILTQLSGTGVLDVGFEFLCIGT